MNLNDIQTLLFVPAGNERFIASAIASKPDAVILDLEDSIATDAKPAARKAVAENLRVLREAGMPALLRVNSAASEMRSDIAAAGGEDLAAVILAKCNDEDAAEQAARLIDQRAPLIALIESPSALFHLPALAAVPEVAGLMFGSEDYAADVGTAPDSLGVQIGAALMVAACSKRKLLPIGLAGPIGNFRDLDAFGAVVERSRQLGFRAAAAIHPRQLPVIAAGFAPSDAEVEKARKIVAAFDGANGKGAVALNGVMLDAPVVEQARRVIARLEKSRR